MPIDKEIAERLGITIVEDNYIVSQQEARISAIKKLLPEIINSDNKLNVEKLEELVGLSNTTYKQQGFELTFAGKGLANAQADSETEYELKLEIEQSKHLDNTNNVIIRGDNLDALKILKQNYSEKIKMIYIDPPYNTGNDDFIYNDNFKDNEASLIEKYNLDEDSINYLTDLYKTKTHSGWLCFMYPRLKLARDLLKEDGVIFVSIDDNEQANLKLLMDEIFGSENFVAQLIVISAPAGTQSSKQVAQQHSYCLMYAKTNDFNTNAIILEEQELHTKYQEIDDIGKYYAERLWKRGIGGKKEDVPSLHFPVYYNIKENTIFIDDEITDTSSLIKIIPFHTEGVLGRWTWSKDKMKNEKDKLLVKMVGGSYKLHKKKYLHEDEGMLLKSIVDSSIGRTELGSVEVKKLMGDKVFHYPKPVAFIKKLIKTSTKQNDIVLDFFAGSGTTAHATMELNKEDGLVRKFILVQLDEKIQDKQAQKFCKDNKLPPFISSITIERVNRAGNKIQEELQHNNKQQDLLEEKVVDLDIGYKVFSLSKKQPLDRINVHSKDIDILYNMLVKVGTSLHKKIEQLSKAIYKVENNYYVINNITLDDTKTLENIKDNYIFINGFANINLEDFLNLLHGTNNAVDNIKIIY